MLPLCPAFFAPAGAAAAAAPEYRMLRSSAFLLLQRDEATATQLHFLGALVGYVPSIIATAFRCVAALANVVSTAPFVAPLLCILPRLSPSAGLGSRYL